MISGGKGFDETMFRQPIRAMKIVQLLLLLETVIFFTPLNPARAQNPSTLGVQLYAGLTITGTVGRVYAVQATTNVAQTNGWICLAFLQLPATNYLWATAWINP